MNQTANEIPRRMYHPLITSVNRKEDLLLYPHRSLFVGFQVATDIFAALAQIDTLDIRKVPRTGATTTSDKFQIATGSQCL